MKHVKYVKRVTFFFGLAFQPRRTRGEQAESLQRNLFISKWLCQIGASRPGYRHLMEVALEGAPTRCPGRESVTGTYGRASWSRRFAVVLVCPLRSCGLPVFLGGPCEAMHLSRPVLCRCVFGNATCFRGTEPTVPVLRASPRGSIVVSSG